MIVITLYQEILPGDAEFVLSQLRSDPTAAVEVRINSPGGSVVEGLAIYNALKPRQPIVYIDGVAASIASMIAMAGQKIIAAENALMMIHDPWVDAQGNSAELRKTADLLDKHRDAMLTAYARSGLSPSQLTMLLAAETWMTATEALELGFIDEVSAALAYAAHAPACFAGYKHPPRKLIMPANSATPAPAPQPSPAVDPNAAANSPQPNGGAHVDATAQAAKNATIQALQERNDEIMMIANQFMGNPPVRDYTLSALANPTITIQQYRDRMLALLGAQAGPLNGCGARIDALDHGTTDFVVAAGDAVAIRAGIKVDKPHPGARDLQGMDLGEIMRVCVSRSGRTLDIGASSRKITVKAAMTTSDFPAILENTLGKALRSGYEAEPSTFEAWTRKVTVPDFKPQSRVLLGSAPDLLLVLEGGAYQEGSMDEDKSVPYSVGKFGRLVNLTWETIVNDDLGAFLRMTQALGQAAARAEADAIYATFAENSGAGPAMQDEVNLFHATHANLATSAADITADALGSARVLLRRQKAVGGGSLNLVPRYLLVAPEQEQAAETLLAASARSLSQGTDVALIPAWVSKLELIVEARLAADAFYLLAGSETIDTLERAWLEVDSGPVIEEEDGFAIDSKQYKVRHVFGSRWLDWRGAVKVPLS